MKFSKLIPLVIASSSILSLSSFAGTDNYISIGASLVNVKVSEVGAPEDYDANGFGAKWINMDSKGSWGTMMGVDYASVSKSYLSDAIKTDLNYLDFSFGVAYRPESAKWFRVYPFIGISSIDTKYSDILGNYAEERKPYFSYGIGAQATIPSTNFFVDVSYKKVDFDVSTSVTYIGLGYKF